MFIGGALLITASIFCSRQRRPRLFWLVQPSQATERVRADFRERGLPLKSGWDARIYGYGRGAGAGAPDTTQVAFIVVAVSLALRVGAGS
jgi:hypothetical protein